MRGGREIGIVDYYEFCGDSSIVGHSHPLSSVFSEVKIFLFVYFLNKLDNVRYYDYYLQKIYTKHCIREEIGP